MPRWLVSMAVLALTAPLAVSCGSSDGGAGSSSSSGIPASTLISALTTAQAGTLCDWENGKTGGYGRVVSCPDGSTQGSDPDKATCVSDVPDVGAACPTLTVGDIESCANAIGPNLCRLPTDPGCAAFDACAGP